MRSCIRQNRIKVLIHPRRESNLPQIQARLLQASEADMTDAARRFQVVSRAMRGELPVELSKWRQLRPETVRTGRGICCFSSSSALRFMNCLPPRAECG
jgi:hypothetical protein